MGENPNKNGASDPEVCRKIPATEKSFFLALSLKEGVFLVEHLLQGEGNHSGLQMVNSRPFLNLTK